MSGTSTKKRQRTLMMGALMGALIGSVAIPATADASEQLRIIDLGLGDNSSANAINKHGHVVGTREGNAFLWRNGQVTDLGSGVANDINNRDNVVGYRVTDSGTRAFLWRNGVMTDLGVLPGGTYSGAEAINDNGEVVGWGSTALDNGRTHAFRWRDGVMTDLGTLSAGWSSVAQDVNNAGVSVGYSSDVGPTAVRWPLDGAIQPLSTEQLFASAVNDRGHITGSDQGFGFPHGFLWYRGQLTKIEPPPGAFFLQPFGINDRVQIVGNTSAGAFLWQHGQTTILPAQGGPSNAYDINDGGQIVGSSATGPFAPNHAVLWAR